MAGKQTDNTLNVAVMLGSVVLMATLFPGNAQARRGGDGQGQTFYAVESKFHGIIQARPQSLQGEWVIGGRSYTTTSKTEFDESEGPLLIGTCAKVRIRNWHIREIESEPISNCR